MFLLPQRYTSQPPKRSKLDTSCAILSGVSNAIIMYGDVNGWMSNTAAFDGLGSGISPPTLNGTLASDYGDRGPALQFDGTTTYVEFPAAGIPYSEFTLLFGCVFDNFTNFRGVFDCVANGASGWGVFQAGGGVLWFAVTSYAGVLSSSGWPTGVMVHGALRNKFGATCDWFRNGAKISSSVGSLPVAPTVPFWIGKQRAGGTAFLQGRMEYCYLLDKYLDDQLIADAAINPNRIFSGKKTMIMDVGSTPPVSAPLPVFANHYRNMGIM